VSGNKLCGQIAVEKDYDKFLRLIIELNDLLDTKAQRAGTQTTISTAFQNLTRLVMGEAAGPQPDRRSRGSR